MKFAVADFLSALIISGVAALGGAAVVFSEFDDAPGGILLGLVLIAVSVALSLRAVTRRKAP